jgi:hypothetical protein
MVSCTSAADRLARDPAAFANPDGSGPKLLWQSAEPANDWPPSLLLSELDEHPDLPNYALNLTCLGEGHVGLFAYALVHGHMHLEPRAEQLSLQSGEKVWSSPTVWLTNLMSDSAPAAELRLTRDELRRIVSLPITVRSGTSSLTYPAPPTSVAQSFTSACERFPGRRTFQSVMPSVEMVYPGDL